MHAVEKWEINVFDGDFGVEIFGQPFGDNTCNPVLSKRGLDKNPDSDNQKEDREPRPF